MTPKQLEQFLTALYLKQGFTAEHARICGWHTTLAEEWGVKTHGINLLEWYMATIKRGTIKTLPEVRITNKNEIFALLDAGRAHGQVATYLGAEEAIRLVKTTGKLGAVGIINSNHFGMAGAPAYQIAKAGYIGIVLSSTPPIIAPTGGVQKALGSNPLAISFPLTGREPIVVDMALSVAALNKIVIAKRENKPVPVGSYLNRKGEFTTSIKDIDDYKLAAPLGGMTETSGYKGYGLAFMSELLVACVLGGKTSAELFSWNRDVSGPAAEAHSVAAIPCDLFRERADVERSVLELVSFIKARERMDGVDEILIPGEDREKSKARAQTKGVDLTDWQTEILTTLSKTYSVPIEMGIREHV